MNSQLNRVQALGAVAVLLGMGAGCADRTIEDYRRQQAEAAQSEMNAVQGDYRGLFTSTVDSGTIGALAVHVESDRVVSSGAANAPEGEQMAVLRVTLTLTGSTPKTLTFNNGAYDRAARTFSASTTVTGRGNASLKGSFSGSSLVGTLMVDGYPDRGGSFTLSRGASAPALVGVRTRVAAEDSFLFNSFLAHNAYIWEGPASDINLTVLRQQTVQEQDLMDVITPYRTVDVSVFFDKIRDDGQHVHSGYTFAGSTWDVRNRRLNGSYSIPATVGMGVTQVNLYCDGVMASNGRDQIGWHCQAISTGGIKKFEGQFMPDGSTGVL